MSLPGLPPPRRTVLPVPPGGAAAARAQGRARRAVAGSVLAVLAVVGASLGVALTTGPGREPGLDVAAPVPGRSGVPGRVTGRVVDATGRPLARIAVLPADLSRVLTRTRADGTFSVRCGTDLLLAPYAPATRDAAARERSPGAADVAWRRVPAQGRCGERLALRLGPGGAVAGRGQPGAEVRVARTAGATGLVRPDGPVFATRVGPDGTWRVEGLDTGRYLLPDGALVDVREGATTRVP